MKSLNIALVLGIIDYNVLLRRKKSLQLLQNDQQVHSL